MDNDQCGLELRSDVGRRLQAVRETLGISQTQVAQQLGISKQLWSAIETGRSLITLNRLVSFSALYPVDLNWLVLGKGAVSDGVRAAPVATPKDRSIPLLDRAGLLSYMRGGPAAVGDLPRVTPFGRYSLATLAVRIFDDSLGPDLRAGDVIVIDEQVPPETGDVVAVVLLASNFVFVRRFEAGKDAKSFRLVSTDARYPTKAVVPADRAKLVGTMVERVRFGTR